MDAKTYRAFLKLRKKYRRSWLGALGLLVAGLLMGTVAIANLAADSAHDSQDSAHLHLEPMVLRRRKLLQAAVTTPDPSTTTLPLCNNNSLEEGGGGLFPDDLFSDYQRQHGAVVLHFLGLMYMFVALAIVCDEFFVPSLGVITERLQISDDVAGATFMAAGGSAPEFFTSVIGVFIAQDNVGIGTIVGSATFNILCVLAFCCLFSNGVLHLTWWPLFRDVSFYIFALALIVIFFLDEKIRWYEALMLLFVYILYCMFMKFNVELEIFVKCRLMGNSLQSVTGFVEEEPQAVRVEQPVESGPVESPPAIGPGPGPGSRPPSAPPRRISAGRRQSIPILHSGAMFRNGIVQLMVHTLDPLSELPGTPDNEESGEQKREGSAKKRPNTANAYTPSTKISSLGSLQEEPELPNYESTCETQAARPDGAVALRQQGPSGNGMASLQNGALSGKSDNSAQLQNNENKKAIEEEEEIEEPLDVSWPSSWRKRLTFIILAPIVFPLWLTLPDVRRPQAQRWFAVTFVGAILWIAFYSYLMVWWANTIGETLLIPTEIMGLTILAAGTSIPDLITSVIVARKGLGDMAVSSSVGSNIFDVCMGLPLPWLMCFIGYSIVGQAPDHIPVVSKGLVCSVGMLFIMIILLMLAIGLFNWKMNNGFGIVMLITYVGFVLVSVFLELDYIECPLRLARTCRP